MIKTITVFCASSETVDNKYIELAEELGLQTAAHGYQLIFGGSGMGSMLALAKSVNEAQGHVTGIISKGLYERGIAYEGCDDLIVESDLHERKKTLIERGDAVIILPGGIGTLDEFLSVTAAKQCKEHQKPIFLLNAFGFYDPLLQMFQKLEEEKFYPKNFDSLFTVVSSVEELLEKIKSL